MRTVVGMLLLCFLVSAHGQEPEGLPPSAEVLEPTYLYEITRHLYRWYMDESDVERDTEETALTFWVRRLDVALDAGDRSELDSICLPLMGIEVRVKKADYVIEDLGVEVKSKGFRIVNVQRANMPAEPPPGTVVVKTGYDQMREYLVRTRLQAEFPDADMREHLRVAVREYLGLDPDKREAGEKIVHIAPLSPVANELWVFVEHQKALIRFSSDIDLENPEMWKHQALGIRTYDILNQTVVSMNEAAGSNAYLTRDQVGRALFNCVILGQRLAVVNPECP